MQGCDSLQRSAIKSTDINMNNVDAPMISFAFDEQEMRMPGRTGSFGLVSGGTAGLVWGYLVGAGYMLVFATIAEMASIYVVGRRTSLAHRFALELTENRLDVYPGMAIWPGIVGLLGRSDDAKVSWSWIARLMLSRDGTAHSSQLPSLFGMVFNTFLVRRLPQVEGMVLVVHFLGVVFMEFLNLGAWDSKGLSFLVGLLAPIHALIGVDSARTDAAPSLGSAGILINVGAACFLLVDWIVVFFLIDKNMTAATTNWNVVMYRGTVAFAVTYCFVVGRKQYRAPVDLVKRHPQDGLARPKPEHGHLACSILSCQEVTGQLSGALGSYLLAASCLHFATRSACHEICHASARWDEEPMLYRSFGGDHPSFGFLTYAAAKARKDVLQPLFSRRGILGILGLDRRKFAHRADILSTNDGAGQSADLLLAFRCFAVDPVQGFCSGGISADDGRARRPRSPGGSQFPAAPPDDMLAASVAVHQSISRDGRPEPPPRHSRRAVPGATDLYDEAQTMICAGGVTVGDALSASPQPSHATREPLRRQRPRRVHRTILSGEVAGWDTSEGADLGAWIRGRIDTRKEDIAMRVSLSRRQLRSRTPYESRRAVAEAAGKFSLGLGLHSHALDCSRLAPGANLGACDRR
ncbi:unnamed protein product [Diplocarpon coronariae]